MIDVSQFERLNIKLILAFASDNLNIDDYFPLYKPGKYTSREYLCNLSKYG